MVGSKAAGSIAKGNAPERVTSGFTEVFKVMMYSLFMNYS